MTKPAPPLPEGINAVRVASGTALVSLEGGAPVGLVTLPPGWYFTEGGHARLWAAVDAWQVRIDAMQHRIDAIQSGQAAPPHPCPETPEHDAGSFATSALCLAVGFVIGRYSRRPNHQQPKR